MDTHYIMCPTFNVLTVAYHLSKLGVSRTPKYLLVKFEPSVKLMLVEERPKIFTLFSIVYLLSVPRSWPHLKSLHHCMILGIHVDVSSHVACIYDWWQGQ